MQDSVTSERLSFKRQVKIYFNDKYVTWLITEDVMSSLISYTSYNILHQMLYVPCPVYSVIGTLRGAQEGMIGSLV